LFFLAPSPLSRRVGKTTLAAPGLDPERQRARPQPVRGGCEHKPAGPLRRPQDSERLPVTGAFIIQCSQSAACRGPQRNLAFAELGKAIKTIFLCRYLHSEALRREIQEGLNVIETWNGANSFILYGKGGEIATNDLENQELTMLALHLLQICLVYINTLMIQRVLTEPDWTQRMLPEDLRALTPLIYSHVTPYGTFRLDMNQRLAIEQDAVAA
jgi:Tn3 transposase DDE domain